ncbi:MAG: sulfatase [Bryobacterales bacterium]
MRRRDFLAITAASAAACTSQEPEADNRPNIIFVLVDDLRWDEIGCMGHPIVKTPSIDRIAAEGALFENAFHTTPLCSPARACFLTGQYAHTNGIIDNTARDDQSHQLRTWPRMLHDAGYETAYVGKWHMGNDDSPRPGFDQWVSFPGQGTYHDPTINENGELKTVKGYTTDIFTDYSVDFIEKSRDKPFCLYLAHKALHPEIQQADDGSLTGTHDFIPADRHKDLYAGAEIPRRPNYGKPPKGKPALERKIGDLPQLGLDTVTDDETIRNRWRELAAVEDGIGRLFDALEKAGKLDNTMFVFAGDNGYFYGEHGLSVERRLAYEESIRMPLLMRFPKAIPAGEKIDEMVLGIDIAPTMLELADQPIPTDIEGRSLLPLLRGEKVEWRDRFLIEYYSDTVFPRMDHMGYQAVRTKDWKYIRYRELEGMDELYNLAIDPYEETNLIDDPVAEEQLEKMRTALNELAPSPAA